MTGHEFGGFCHQALTWVGQEVIKVPRQDPWSWVKGLKGHKTWWVNHCVVANSRHCKNTIKTEDQKQ